jgi:hypothetical protein
MIEQDILHELNDTGISLCRFLEHVNRLAAHYNPEYKRVAAQLEDAIDSIERAMERAPR